ncbi:MAG: NfeD family protein [Armatimonadetes bacterium]|nr:NfeD family protein [Armatimonadota bacterium]
MFKIELLFKLKSFLENNPLVLISIIIALSVIFLLSLILTIKHQKQKPVSGKEELIGSTGIVRSQLDPEGIIFLNGELWKAYSNEGVIIKGEKVKVEDIDGLKLKVSRYKAGIQ